MATRHQAVVSLRGTDIRRSSGPCRRCVGENLFENCNRRSHGHGRHQQQLNSFSLETSLENLYIRICACLSPSQMPCLALVRVVLRFVAAPRLRKKQSHFGAVLQDLQTSEHGRYCFKIPVANETTREKTG
jgi:hypothetical protein